MFQRTYTTVYVVQSNEGQSYLEHIIPLAEESSIKVVGSKGPTVQHKAMKDKAAKSILIHDIPLDDTATLRFQWFGHIVRCGQIDSYPHTPPHHFFVFYHTPSAARRGKYHAADV